MRRHEDDHESLEAELHTKWLLGSLYTKFGQIVIQKQMVEER